MFSPLCSAFYGEGIYNKTVPVGSDYDVRSPNTFVIYNLDCGTTGKQPIEGIYAKCTINGDEYAATYSAIPGSDS